MLANCKYEQQVFIATKEQAMEATIMNNGQFRVRMILSYRCDSKARTIMEFYVEWNIGDKL